MPEPKRSRYLRELLGAYPLYLSRKLRVGLRGYSEGIEEIAHLLLELPVVKIDRVFGPCRTWGTSFADTGEKGANDSVGDDEKCSHRLEPCIGPVRARDPG